MSVKFIERIKCDFISILDKSKVEKGNKSVDEVTFKGRLG